MELRYKLADSSDIKLLTKTRLTVVREVYKLKSSENLEEFKKETYEYYQKSIADGTHIACLVFDHDQVIGTGGITTYDMMPTYEVPSGKRAYLLNIYTDPKYRRQGIAYQIVDLLVKAARDKGIQEISLAASEMGRPLYERYGFVADEESMVLRYETSD